MLQSLAKGKIIVASNIGGLPELVDDGITGYLFEAGNSTDLINKIENIYSMPSEMYENMAIKICKRAENRHYWELYADMLLDEYNKLLRIAK